MQIVHGLNAKLESLSHIEVNQEDDRAAGWLDELRSRVIMDFRFRRNDLLGPK